MNRNHPSSTDPDALLRALVEQPIVPMAPSDANDLRERVTRRIAERQARFVGRGRGVWPRRRALLAVAACLLLAVGGAISWSRRADRVAPKAAEVTVLAGSAEVARDGIDQALRPSTRVPLQADEEIRTGPNARARASLTTGAIVDIGPAARLRLQPARWGQQGSMRDRVELSAGKIDVQVPKLADGDEVIVHTEAVTVVVHGTRFSVEHWTEADGIAGGTRVAVSEGKVAVFTDGQDRLLTAGAVWTLPAPGQAAPAPMLTAVSPGPTSSTAAVVSASTLAAENALLGEAMQQRRLGHSDRALSVLEDLIARYPNSPLVETARIELLRVFAEKGPSGRLRREAERYLRDYPDGHARPEVMKMLDGARVRRP